MSYASCAAWKKRRGNNLTQRHEDTKKNVMQRLEDLATITIDCGFKIHSKLGPGLLESVYEVI